MNPATGQCNDVGVYTWNDDSDAKDTRQHIDRTFSGTLGRLVLVNFDCKSFSNKLSYTIRLTQA
jgi:uncharacterized protein YcbX